MEMETEIGIAENELTYPRIQVVNPARENIEITIYSKKEMDYTIQILDLTGRLVSHNSDQLNTGSTILNLQKPDISGMYIVALHFGNGKRTTERVLVF
jgi:peptide deformylase